jgi:NACHT domain
MLQGTADGRNLVGVKFNRDAVVAWAAGICGGAGALGAVLVTFTGSSWHILVLALACLAAVTLLLLIIAGLAPLSRIFRWARRPQMLTPEEIDRARISLHAALSGAWSEDGSEVYEDFPMRVSFAPWTEDVSSQRCQEAAARGGDSVAKRFQAGDFNSVAEAFSQVPRYRRVVLGEAGAGKTVLMAELQRRLVEAPQPGDPSPVIVSAAAWRPDRQSLIDWLTQQLAADYGWLSVAHARALVTRGIVLPILDGLDEMPSSLRPHAIARINTSHVYRPLIVTSREGEYRDAVRENRVGVKGAAVVVVQPLHLEDIRAYLDAAGGDGWGKVLDEMDANGALARVLTNPLMLWLARIEYERESPESLTLFGDRRSLENFLLGQFVPSVYSGDSGHAPGGQFRGTTQKAERWLVPRPVTFASSVTMVPLAGRDGPGRRGRTGSLSR